MKTFLKNLTIDELKGFFTDMGERPFRARQLFHWMYRAGAPDFAAMTNLPAELRRRLAEAAELFTLKISVARVSAIDDTRKYSFETFDGQLIESAFMKYRYGSSVCVSSQIGCRMGCVFCASGFGGLRRGLSAGEMLDQLVLARMDSGEKAGHVVIMGMGEPFDNFDEMKRFIEIAGDADGLYIGRRSITVSTCGLTSGIRRMARELPQVGLALSLHAPDDALRSSLMPINRSEGIDALLDAAREHVAVTGRRISFEYALIKGLNDGGVHAEKLARRLRGLNCHVNLIVLNEVDGTKLRGGDRADAERFMDVLKAKGIQTTVRREMGGDIRAACGQLRGTCEL